MVIDTPPARSNPHNGPSDESSRSRLSVPLDDVFQVTTRRLQLKSVLAQLTLDRYSVMMAIKASIPPTVLLCVIQSNTWINLFKTQAYLAAILSACAMPALPRARLIEYNFQLAFAIALSYCWVLLGAWSGLQARKHTADSPEGLNAYNASAETINAIFLIFWTWCAFTIKSAFPAWGLQSTLSGIFAVATLPVVAQASSMREIINKASITLGAFLSGQAVGFVNALIVFPQSCRGVFRKDMRACLDGLVAVMRAQGKCIEDFRAKKISAEGEDDRSTSVRQLQNALQLFINLIVKARDDVRYAEREMSWSRLDHPDLDHIALMLVDLVAPASGLGSAADMLQLAADSYCCSSDNAEGANGHVETENNLENEQYWHSLEERMHEHSLRISEAIIEGVEHAKIRLELGRGRSLLRKIHTRETDEENQGFSMNPGGPNFIGSYRNSFDKCCVLGQEGDGMNGERLLDHYIRHRPRVGDISRITPEAHSNTLRYFLLLHVSSASLGICLWVQLLIITVTNSPFVSRRRTPQASPVYRRVPRTSEAPIYPTIKSSPILAKSASPRWRDSV